MGRGRGRLGWEGVVGNQGVGEGWEVYAVLGSIGDVNTNWRRSGKRVEEWGKRKDRWGCGGGGGR